MREQRDLAIAEVIGALTLEQTADPRWRVEGNDAFWTLYFQRRHEQDLADRGNNGQVEGRFNSRGRKRWWGGNGRNLFWVPDYIAADNEPRLTMPPRTSSWMPRRMGAASSSSATSSSSGGRSTPPGLRAAPPSLTPPSLNSGQPAPMRNGMLRINEPRSSQRRAASPPRSLFRRLV